MGCLDGLDEGCADGCCDGCLDGLDEGCIDGCCDGCLDGGGEGCGIRGSKADMDPHSGEVASNREISPQPVMTRSWFYFESSGSGGTTISNLLVVGGPARRFIPWGGRMISTVLKVLKKKKNTWILEAESVLHVFGIFD